MAAMSSTTNTFGEMYFKPVEGGFLFETPNPWLFAPARGYIVSAHQKEALLGIINPRRPVLRIMLISFAIITFTCIISLFWWGLSSRGTPNGLDLLGMAVTILVPLYVAMLVWIRRYLRRIKPIVAAAVPTKLRLTVGERYKVGWDAIPKPLLIIIVIAGPLALVANMLSIATSPVPLRLGEARFIVPLLQSIMPLLFAGFAAYVLSRRRRRSK